LRTIENPISETLRSLGAEMAPVRNVGGQKSTQTALSFGDVGGELEAIQTSAALVDLSARGLLAITGADRAAWLHGLCTQEIKGMSSGEGAYACHIDIKGRIQADMRVSVFEEMILLDLEPGMAAPLRRLFKRFVVMEEVKISDRSAAAASLALVGPAAGQRLEAVSGLALTALEAHHLLPASIFGCEALVCATDQFGPPAFRVSIARDQYEEVYRGLLAAEGGTRPAGRRALELARIEAGVPRFGAELGGDVLFNEAGLDTAVNFNKGCYLGQEVVERVDARGKVGRKLMGLRIDVPGGGLPPVGSVVANSERKLGALTSVGRYGQRVLGMGFLHRADNAPGAAVQVRLADSDVTYPGVVVERGQLSSS